MTYAQAYHFRAVTWYGLLGWRASGLVTRSLEPLPAYSALKFYTAFMGSGHLGRSITNFTGVDGYEFKKDDQMIWILWSNDGGSHSISLPALPKQLFNVFGEAIPVQPKIDITTAPVYVLWDVVP